MASASNPKGPLRVPAWLTAVLDAFLSEPLRAAPPLELRRHRLLVGFTLFALVFSLVELTLVPFTQPELVTLVTCGCHVVTLAVARRARTLTVPALLLCTSVSTGFLVSVFVSPYPEGGFHATAMLMPLFAVYLVGPRWGFVVCSVFCVFLGVLHPLYRELFTEYTSTIPFHLLAVMHGAAAVAILSAWGLCALYTSSHDQAEGALERTLKTLRESEGKLVSLLESTDDLVFSLDRDKRLVTVNAAMRQLYSRIRGPAMLTGQPFIEHSPAAVHARWFPLFDQVLAGERLRFEEEIVGKDVRLVLDVSMSPILGADGQVTGVTFFGRDITARKLAERRLGEMHRSLVDVSRSAGMAEVATGVLHNVGNTLNSVNISAGILNDQLRHSRVSGLRKAAELLVARGADVGAFLTEDPRGRQLPGYLLVLAETLELERENLRREVGALLESVEHIKSIVSMQQQHARTAGVVECLPVPQLIEEALRLHAVPFEREGILIVQEYAEVPAIPVDRHKLLQILINLLSNARHALRDGPSPDKHLRIRIRLSPDGEQLLIEVEDNGVGIEPKHLGRLFTQGFTTKKSGHGFGLHISALAATEMSGQLTCTSAGPGTGATFTLLLPVTGPVEWNEPPSS